MNRFPKTIRRTLPIWLEIQWNTGEVHTVLLKTLRTHCPCALCRGENIMGTVYRIPELQTYTPGMYELERVEPVGTYALRFYWKDGHDSGIYDWELLYQLGEKYGLSEQEQREYKERLEKTKE